MEFSIFLSRILFQNSLHVSMQFYIFLISRENSLYYRILYISLWNSLYFSLEFSFKFTKFVQTILYTSHFSRELSLFLYTTLYISHFSIEFSICLCHTSNPNAPIAELPTSSGRNSWKRPLNWKKSAKKQKNPQKKLSSISIGKCLESGRK